MSNLQEELRNTRTYRTLSIVQALHNQPRQHTPTTKSCYMEFDPMKGLAKLPSMFTTDFGALLGNYVILQDPKRNQIRVAIERKRDKIYLTRGWTRLRDFYGLDIGGWLKIFYISPILFYISVLTRTGIEVAYPQRTPPHRFMLPHQLGDANIAHGPVPFFIAPRVFFHSLEKTLSSADIESGVLRLCANGFCNLALPNNKCELTLVDWLGHIWKCTYDPTTLPCTSTIIYGQWRDLCKERNLAEGSIVKFGATHPTNNTIIHVKVCPFLGVRTTLIAPTPGNEQNVLYQTQQFYML